MVRSLGLRLPPGQRVTTHSHPWHQLVYATDGVVKVSTPTSTWVVPSHRAVWIPAGFPHGFSTIGAVRLQAVYLRPEQPSSLPETCRVLQVSTLLRELVLETLRVGLLSAAIPEEARFAAVLSDEIHRMQDAALQIPFPHDPRAIAVADRARADLGHPRPLAELALGSGASPRTIERLFVEETGMTFGRWLQQIRVMHALECLTSGESVTDAALSVGYESTSSFISVFKRTLGMTPGRYLRSTRDQGHTKTQAP